MDTTRDSIPGTWCLDGALHTSDTASTSFNEPYNIARAFASLDHISHGRSAWNVVTSANDYAAKNYGHAKLPPHAERYERAHEFVEVVKQLWDCWEPDAFIYDREQKLTFDPAKFHIVAHEGKHFRVNGGLNIAPAPQGHPVIIQAGASDTGRELAAETAHQVPDLPALPGQRPVQPRRAVRARLPAGRAVAVAPVEVPVGEGAETFFSASSSRPFET